MANGSQRTAVGLLLALAAALVAAGSPEARSQSVDAAIRPWDADPRYWQYKGQPVLLLGGSDDDNLFQWPEELLGPQLDRVVAAGGNYVRNTMSDRPDRGFELHPHARLADGRYDLDTWNEEYWQRFATFLRMTAERDIIVQVEVWDRFDFSLSPWRQHSWNPANNVTYTHASSGLEADYPKHPGENVQPFFFTTPAQRSNVTVLRHQQRFVERMLSISLEHGHVLYCIDNETKGEEAWSRYWAEFIKERAAAADRRVYITEMWDDWDIKAERHRATLDHPELYDFADMSQNNHNRGREHWANAVWVRNYLAAKPRPVNSVKTYGADGNKFGHTDQDGLERFFRHILAGFAAVRFHRPDSGLGINDKAQAAIRTARELETVVRAWEMSPDADVLDNTRGGDVYTATATGGRRVLYFPSGGAARVSLEAAPHRVTWIGLGQPRREEPLQAPQEGSVTVTAPTDGHWVAVVERM